MITPIIKVSEVADHFALVTRDREVILKYTGPDIPENLKEIHFPTKAIPSLIRLMKHMETMMLEYEINFDSMMVPLATHNFRATGKIVDLEPDDDPDEENYSGDYRIGACAGGIDGCGSPRCDVCYSHDARS